MLNELEKVDKDLALVCDIIEIEKCVLTFFRLMGNGKTLTEQVFALHDQIWNDYRAILWWYNCERNSNKSFVRTQQLVSEFKVNYSIMMSDLKKHTMGGQDESQGEFDQLI